jgi:hypothetical protein
MDQTMDHERLLLEIKDLLMIPNFNRAIYHKVEELKIILSEDIECFSKISRTIEPGSECPRFRDGKEFQLARFGESLWIPSLRNPRPGKDIYDIIPQEVIDYIVRFDTEPGVIVMKSGVKLPGLKGRKFDLSFEKLSDRGISGVIKEKKCTGEGPEGVLDLDMPGRDEMFYREMGEIAENLKILVSYLLKNHDYYRHVISEFFIRWKPLIDNQLIGPSDSMETIAT